MVSHGIRTSASWVDVTVADRCKCTVITQNIYMFCCFCCFPSVCAMLRWGKIELYPTKSSIYTHGKHASINLLHFVSVVPHTCTPTPRPHTYNKQGCTDFCGKTTFSKVGPALCVSARQKMTQRGVKRGHKKFSHVFVFPLQHVSLVVVFLNCCRL